MNGAPAPYPLSLSDITPDWMTKALSSRYPGTIITAVSPLHTISGTATKVRYALDYAGTGNPHRLPATLWLKGGFEAHSAATTAGSRNEACFYRDIAPRLDAVCPLSFHQSVSADHGDGLTLLEDLLSRNAVFCQLPHPLGTSQVAAVLDMQARYHAAYWNSPALADFSWLRSGGFIVENGIVDYFFSFWDDMARLPRFRHIAPALAGNRQQLRQAVHAMVNINRDKAVCLIHGDTHMGNLFIDGDGRPGYLDWQTVMRGCWAYDVAPLMVSALSVERRRSDERELLRHYLECLNRHGAAAPDFDEAWLRYRQFALWSFMFALCPPQFQSEENCEAVAERANAALTDLDTLAAFDY